MTSTTRETARKIATDVAYVAGLAITANHGTLTNVIGQGVPADGTDPAVAIRLVIPCQGRLEDHQAEVATVIATLNRHGATVVDRYAPDPNAATTVRCLVWTAAAAHWRELSERATPTFRLPVATS